MEILLIEDSSSDIMIFKKALVTSGSESKLIVCEDGDKAMDYFTESASDLNFSRPDLIVLDLNLPGKDGLSLLKYLKTDGQLRRIPVVVLTDSDSSKDISDAYNLFANCFIIKPIDSDVYIKYVQFIDSFWSTTVTFSNC